MARTPITTPPRALPLVGLGMVGIVVGICAINAAGALAFLVSEVVTGGGDLVPRDAGRLLLIVDFVLVLVVFNVATLIAAMALLGVLVARWVAGQPPDTF